MLRDPGRYDYLPLIDRPQIRWPNGARVAFWVCPNIEFYELDPPDGQGRPLWPRPNPDTLNYSLRDYGNRSGIWRVMEALEKYGVRASVSLNAAMCDHMPEIVDACVRLNWELFSHGVYNTRLIYGYDRGRSPAGHRRQRRDDQAAQRQAGCGLARTRFELDRNVSRSAARVRHQIHDRYGSGRSAYPDQSAQRPADRSSLLDRDQRCPRDGSTGDIRLTNGRQ